MKIIYSIINWLFGLSFFFLSFGVMTISPLAGICLISAGALLLPPIRKLVYTATKKSIPAWIRFISVIILVGFFWHFSGESQVVSPSVSDISKVEAKVDLENSSLTPGTESNRSDHGVPSELTLKLKELSTMNALEARIIGLLVIALLAVLFFALKMRFKSKAIESKYSKISDVDREFEKMELERENVNKSLEELRISYSEKRVIFEDLAKEAAIYDEDIQLAELGFYKPHFDFGTSERYKNEIIEVKKRQKDLISSKDAIYCKTEWAVEGSKAKGRTMTNRGIRLTARAFNNECDAAISNARWNNIDRMESRIEKAYEAINKLNQSSAIVISHEYYRLKQSELRLSYEYADKKQREKEEQQEIRRNMREEAKLEQEMATALREEQKYNKLLDKAKKEAEKATGGQLASLNEKIAILDEELKTAQEKSERAKSMAEQTKQGHIYVISNLGSFGENVYKIGMTRRLEPLDRVKELGDASVPFTFDVHAMVHSANAPELERALHKKFDSKRLNLVNSRKEFFRVSLADIEQEVKKISPEADFTETAEARDYKETQSIISKRAKIGLADGKTVRFPETL